MSVYTKEKDASDFINHKKINYCITAQSRYLRFTSHYEIASILILSIKPLTKKKSQP